LGAPAATAVEAAREVLEAPQARARMTARLVVEVATEATEAAAVVAAAAAAASLTH